MDIDSRGHQGAYPLEEKRTHSGNESIGLRIAYRQQPCPVVAAQGNESYRADIFVTIAKQIAAL